MILQPTVFVCTNEECQVGNYKNDQKASSGIDPSAEGIIEIPSTHEGLPVTSIDSWTFAFMSKITEIIINAKLVTIKARAFTDCYSLRHINIPETVQTFETASLMFYNTTRTQYGLSDGKVIILFEGRSQLTKLCEEIFGFKETVIIVFQQTPLHRRIYDCLDTVFKLANPIIFSPSPISLCGVPSKCSCKTYQFQFYISIRILSYLSIFLN